MNKADLIETIIATTGCTNTAAALAFDRLVSRLAKAIATDGQVMIRGLGTFARSTTPAHKGRNPRTGEAIMIPEIQHIRFRAGRQFSHSVLAHQAANKRQGGKISA